MSNPNALHNQRITQIFERYHQGKIPDLPSQVYLDVGYLIGYIIKLEKSTNKLEDSQMIEDQGVLTSDDFH